jgi:hypothetical protein
MILNKEYQIYEIISTCAAPVLKCNIFNKPTENYDDVP